MGKWSRNSALVLSCAIFLATLVADGLALFSRRHEHFLRITPTIAAGVVRRGRDDVRLCLHGDWVKERHRPRSERPTSSTQWDRAGIAGSRTRWANGEWAGSLGVSYLYPLIGSAVLPCAWLWRRWRRARPGTPGWRPLLWVAASLCLGGVAAYGITRASAFKPGSIPPSPPAPVILPAPVIASGSTAPPTPGEAWTLPGLGLELVWVAPGSFEMGSKDAVEDERPVHPVQISQGFWLGKCEVTQGEYGGITGRNPSLFTAQGPRNPVTNVSWTDAMAFCELLAAREKGRVPEGYEYRLPTEAEWEYACRAGSTSRYSFGDDESALGEYAWHSGNSEGRPHEVGTRKANAWGLYDMHGSVCEWCLDRYDPDYYGRSAAVDPVNTAPASCRVMRGRGLFGEDLRSACRAYNRSDFTGGGLGFRVCLGPLAEKGAAEDLPLVDELRLCTQKRVEALRKESLDELMAAIYLEEGYTNPVLLNGAKRRDLDAEVVLSNRRYARLRQMLRELPPDQASAVCRSMQSQARERCAETVARVLRYYEIPGSPKNAVSLQGNKWGTCAGVLLASEFCDTKTVLDAIGQAEEAESGWLATMNAKPDVYPATLAGAIKSFAALQTTFKLVALSIAAHRDGAVSQATRGRLDELLAAMQAKTVQLVSWDAAVTPYDSAHRREGEPIDVSKGVEDIRIYELPRDRLMDSAWQQSLLDQVRQLLSADIR